MFQHFGLKLPISGFILTIFSENRQKCEYNTYSNPQRGSWRKTRLLSVDRWWFIRRCDL